MRIAFVDVTPWSYTVETPYQTPLGGSQSAICYLAEQLSCQGHEVYLLNKTLDAHVSRGVVCSPLDRVADQTWQQFDVVIIQNWAKLAIELRPRLRPDAKLILWTQHADDQPAIQALSLPQIRAAHDAFVFVSHWQQQRYQKLFAIEPTRCQVLQNAISPTIENLFNDGKSILSHKALPPTIAYTSTPFRGLSRLLELFPQIQQAVPEVRLKVYSSMQVYQLSAERDASDYGTLYEKCRSMPGVEYVGSLPQPQLAEQLKQVSVLAYANHFAETSCIAVMEAMASGCQIVTSQLGALEETTAGFGSLISVAGDRTQYANQFVAATVQCLRQQSLVPEVVETKLRAQVTHMNQSATWSVRATQWQAWLASLNLPIKR